MINKKFLFLFLFLLLSVSVMAKQPSQESLQGIQIFYPDVEYLKAQQTVVLSVHTTNITTGKIIPNTDVNCTLHFYNQTGGHQLEAELENDVNLEDLTTTILGGNLTLGGHVYRVSCVTDGIGGSVQGIVQVTPTGTIEDTSDSIIFVALLGVYLLLFFLTLASLKFIPQGNNLSEDGKIISINLLKNFRPLIMGVAYLFLFATIYLSGVLSISFLPNNFMGSLLFAISMFMGAMGLPLLWLMILKIIDDFRTDNKIKEMLERGIGYD